jgi:dienelactone hydrolase
MRSEAASDFVRNIASGTKLSRRQFLETSLLVLASVSGSPQLKESRPAGSAKSKIVMADDFVAFLGGFPDKPPLNTQVTELQEEDGYTRKLIAYTGESGIRVPAFLLVPRPQRKSHPFPGIVAIHQDGNRPNRDIGKSEPAGIAGDTDQHYGKELCLRGFVVLCPDRPGFEQRGHQEERSKLAPVQAELFEMHRAVDCLLQHSEADSYQGVGGIGHSAGGYLATMLAFTDPRVRACAVSCGTWLWRWRDLPQSEKPKGYNIPQPPLPGLGDRIDQDDFIAGIAPRPYFQSLEPWSAKMDEELPRRARARYAELGVLERFEWATHSGHTFPKDVRLRAYEWLERWLKA